MKIWVKVMVWCLLAVGAGFFLPRIKEKLIQPARPTVSPKKQTGISDETRLLEFTKKELDRSLKKIEQLNKDLQGALQQKQTESARYLAAQNNLAKVSQELSLATNELRQARQEAASIPLFKKKIEELSQGQEARTSEYNKLQEEKASLETILAKIQKDILKQNAYIDSLRDKIESQNLILEQKDKESKALELKLKESQNWNSLSTNCMVSRPKATRRYLH
ncbi:MAG: hypothetical protein AMJ95_02725 [Omnitrophica WOR_2 bacterium SM23_72]|nr:MAG: hypothetical protein AMJ95_02725 [Omnitrophica WOR_2 bacterium SM23_72]